MIEREPKTLIADTDPEALWAYILGLARICGEELKTSPAQPRLMGRRHMTMCRFL